MAIVDERTAPKEKCFAACEELSLSTACAQDFRIAPLARGLSSKVYREPIFAPLAHDTKTFAPFLCYSYGLWVVVSQWQGSRHRVRQVEGPYLQDVKFCRRPADV